LFLTAVLLATIRAAASDAVFHSALDTAFSPDGATLAVGDATMKSLLLIDPTSRKIKHQVALAGSPDGLAWAVDGRHVFVAESGSGHIAEVDPATGTITRRFVAGRHSRGIAVAGRRNYLLACDWGLDRLTTIDLISGKTIANIPVGRQPTSVAISPDESVAVVSNLIPATAATAPDHSTEIVIVDLETQTAKSSVRLPTGSTNARGVTISGDGKKAFVVHTLGRFHLPTTQLDRGWVNTNALSIIDLQTNTLSATVLLDQVMEGAADPWGVAIDPRGMLLYITLSGVHQLAVIDLEGLAGIIGPDPASLANDLSALHRNGLIRRINLPAKGPRGISVSPDGKQIAVAGYFSGNVVMLDADGGNPGSIPLGPQPEPDLVRRGEIAFHDADLCFQRWLSCATCHPGARSDGLNWDLLNDGIGNPKNTRSMLLSHATPPVMSLGVRASMEVATRAGFIHIQFTEPPPGEVEAVIAYFKSLKPVTSPHRKADGSLTESATRGEKIFHSPAVGCADCHPAPLFTDLALSDVGTASDRDRGASAYDTPTLVELWSNPPFLHDGRAATLREVFTDHNADDRHGVTSTLTTAELDDLIEYLLSL
jgi:DNA-binding beta-propeller fold protein YncE/mono/diheme cytochrome c family protein